MEWLDDGVCVFFGRGDSQSSQLSSTSGGLDASGSVVPSWLLDASCALGDVCPGVSMPNSLQNNISRSTDFESLPESFAPAPLLCDAEDDRDDRSPWTDNRSLLRDFELDDRMVRVSVALIPSSPTVACRMSSKNVQSPSLRSDAICLPVRMSISRDGGGKVCPHCDIASWACLSLIATGMRSRDGKVADRGGRPIRSVSAWPLGDSDPGGLLLVGPEPADKRDKVRACDPWNTRLPFEEMVVPLFVAERRL